MCRIMTCMRTRKIIAYIIRHCWKSVRVLALMLPLADRQVVRLAIRQRPQGTAHASLAVLQQSGTRDDLHARWPSQRAGKCGRSSVHLPIGK